MADASEFGESTYDNALPWTRIAAVPHTQYGNFAPLLPKPESRHAARTAHDKAFPWFEEDGAAFPAPRSQQYLTLNEAERRAAREHHRSAERRHGKRGLR